MPNYPTLRNYKRNNWNFVHIVLMALYMWYPSEHCTNTGTTRRVRVTRLPVRLRCGYGSDLTGTGWVRVQLGFTNNHGYGSGTGIEIENPYGYGLGTGRYLTGTVPGMGRDLIGTIFINKAFQVSRYFNRIHSSPSILTASSSYR